MVSALSRLSLLLVCFQLFFIGLIISFGGVYLSTPVDNEMTKSDIIVVLGGGTADRLAKGIDLYRKGFGNRLLVTGFPELKADAVPSYTQWRVDYLTMAGVPAQSLVLNGTAKSSMEEAALVKNYLLTNHVTKAIVVSDPPHIRRLSFIYGSVFKSSVGLSYNLVASEPVWWDPYRWWGNKQSAQFVILEAIKFLYYFINDLF